MVKVGVVGAGNMGKNHIRVIKELKGLFELVGVYDPNTKVINEQGLNQLATESLNDLIEKSEALIVAAPSSMHKAIAIKAAIAHKHLLVEKPLALSEEDAREICKLYHNSNRVLMVGHIERFNGAITELEKVLEDEKILAVNMERCSSKDLRIADTDVIYDLMIHDVDILLHSILPFASVRKLEAFGRRVYSSEYVDYVEGLFSFDNDVVASIICSRATENKIRRLNIHCEKSFVEVDLLNKNISVFRKTKLEEIGIYSTAYKQENVVEKVYVPNDEPLKMELKHFYSCIKKGIICKTSGES